MSGNVFHVFISWSGEPAKQIAGYVEDLLRIFFPDPNIDFFLSSKRISSGERFNKTLDKYLAESSFGILILTNNNFGGHWLLFEAGALAKAADSRLTPIFFDRKKGKIELPLSTFQYETFEKESFLRLICSIKEALFNKEPNDAQKKQLMNHLDEEWSDFEQKVKQIIQEHSDDDITKTATENVDHPIVDEEEQTENNECLEKKDPTHENNIDIKGFLRSYSEDNPWLQKSFKSFIEEVLLTHKEFHQEKSLHDPQILSSVMKSFNLFFEGIEASGKKIDYLNIDSEPFFFLFLMHANLIKNDKFREGFESFKNEKEQGGHGDSFERLILEGPEESKKSFLELEYLRRKFGEKFCKLGFLPQEFKRYIENEQLDMKAIESRLLPPYSFGNTVIRLRDHNDKDVLNALKNVLPEISNGTHDLPKLFRIGVESFFLIDIKVHTQRAKRVIQKIKDYLPRALESMKDTTSICEDIEYIAHTRISTFKTSVAIGEYQKYQLFFTSEIKKHNRKILAQKADSLFITMIENPEEFSKEAGSMTYMDEGICNAFLSKVANSNLSEVLKRFERQGFQYIFPAFKHLVKMVDKEKEEEFIKSLNTLDSLIKNSTGMKKYWLEEMKKEFREPFATYVRW